MFIRLLLVLLFAGAIVGGIFGWKHYQGVQQASQGGAPPPPVVAALPVEREDWQPRLRATGSLVAAQGIDVANEVEGLVTEILFESGERVKAGDRLVQLDDDVDRAELAGLVAQQNLAKIKLARFSRLLEDRSAAQSEFDAAKAELDVASAAVATKKALIAKKAITAPFDGELGIRNVDLGEYLAAGSRIVELDALDPIYVDYALPERHLSDVAVGKQVEVRVAAYPERTFSGTIEAIAPGLAERTRTLSIRAKLANKEGLMRPGMFAEVDTLLPVRGGLLTVPRTAITFAPYGDTAYRLVEQDGATTVERVPVRTGEVIGERVEVTAGLDANDRVVVAGQVKLRNSQAVRIDNSVLPDETGPLTP